MVIKKKRKAGINETETHTGKAGRTGKRLGLCGLVKGSTKLKCSFFVSVKLLLVTMICTFYQIAKSTVLFVRGAGDGRPGLGHVWQVLYPGVPSPVL